jgi:hypothetical protein
MSIKTLVVGTLAGGVTIFAVGTLIFALPPLAEFYTYALTSGSATNVPRQVPILWAAFLGALSYGALVTLAIGKAEAPDVPTGFKIGAVVGFLLWFTADLMLYAISNVGTLTSTLADALVEPIPGAFGGAVIARVLRRTHHAGESTVEHASA